MGLVVADLMAKLGLDTSAFDRGLDGATRGRGLSNLGASMTRAGSAMTRSITLPVVAAAGAAVVMGVKFEESMKLIQTQANGSAGDVKFLSAEVLKLGAAGQHGPDELANALYHLKSVGMDNKDAMDALTASEHLASVGNADLEATTNAVAGAFKSGIKGAQDFNLTAATVNATIGAGNLRMDDLNSAFGTGILVTAKQFGISMIDVGSALAMMTSRGIPATRAATSIKMALTLMAAPTAKASKVMDDLGLKSDSLAKAMRSSGGLPSAIGLLESKLHGLSKTDQTTALTKMFGARSSQAVLTLISNTKDYAKVQQQVIDNATNARFSEATKAQEEDAGAKLKHLYASLKTAGVQFGNVLLPMVSGIVEPMGKLMEAVGKMPGWEKKIIVGAGLIAAAIGPLLITVGKIATGAGALQKLFGKGGVGGLGGGVLGGAADATLKAAISLNTTATEANTLALGGTGGGGVVKKVEKVAEKGGLLAAGVTAGALLSLAAIPAFSGGANYNAGYRVRRSGKASSVTNINDDPNATAGAYGSSAERAGREAGTESAQAFAGAFKPAILDAFGNKDGAGLAAGLSRGADAADGKGKQAGAAFADGFKKGGFTPASISKTGGILSGISAGRKELASFRAMAAKGTPMGPLTHFGERVAAVQRLEKQLAHMRANAARPTHMGHLDATQMLNEIARVSRALGGISSAARTASNAAANAIGAASGVQSKSYRGYFMASGGYVPARPGGTPVVLGEGGEGETVIPDSKMGRGTVLNINVANVHGTDRAAATKLANMAGEIFMQQVRFA